MKKKKEAKMNEVHCENCKYYGWSNIDKCFDDLPESFLGLTTRGWTNKDNNCPHYKRKWWKIWVT